MIDLNSRYFEWLFNLVGAEKYYKKLIRHLNNRFFAYSNPMDENRFMDGIDLRYRFGFECNIDDRLIASELDDHPCTMLELMAALALRCEENIMAEAGMPSRTPVWFHEMLDSLGLSDETDRKYDDQYVDDVIDRFNDRDYAPDGRGSLFSVEGCHDFKDLEIWQQMCRFLNSLPEGVV